MAYRSERTGEEVDALLDKVEKSTIDTELSTTSDNAIANSAVTKAINEKADSSEVEELRREIGSISADLLTPITYAELKALKNEGKLVAGMMYRITDYVTTTSQTNTRSANHRFDVIVTALDNHTLSEDAMAIQHEGDEYFANSNLAAWRLRYRFDNDTAEFGWARREDAIELAKWSSQWGLLDTGDIDGSKGYIEKEIDGVTKYLYAPADRGSFLQEFSFYKKEVVGSIEDYNELIFESDNAPSIEGEDWDGDGEYDDSYTDWYNVSEIVVKTASGDVVAVLRNADNGDFYDERDDEYYMAGNYAYFNASPEYVDGKYRYTPENIDGWWYGFMGGSVTNYNNVPYSGDYSDLYYCFDAPLPMSKEQQPIPQVCSDSGVLYLSDDWSDTITYSPFVSGGKGIIYRLIDEWNNDLRYDFKNIQHFYEGAWYYTFNRTDTDASLSKDVVYGNTYSRLVSTVTNNRHTPLLIPRLIHNIPSGYNKIINNNIDVEVRNVLFVKDLRGVKWETNVVYAKNVNGYYVETFIIDNNGAMTNVEINGGIHTLYCNVQIHGGSIHLLMNNSIPPSKPSSLRLLKTSVTGSWFSPYIDMGTVGTMGYSLEISVGYTRNCQFSGYGKFTSDCLFTDSVFKLSSEIELLKPANGATMGSASQLISDVCLDGVNWKNTSKETIVLDDKLYDGSGYNNPFEWRITKNTSGEVKQWCPADLV
jgi:hypothetical protein